MKKEDLGLVYPTEGATASEVPLFPTAGKCWEFLLEVATHQESNSLTCGEAGERGSADKDSTRGVKKSRIG